MTTPQKFVAGAVLLYVGAVCFLIGLMLSGTANTLFDNVTKTLFPPNWDAPTRAAIFLFLGGLIGVTGLVLCVWPVRPLPPRPPPSPTVIIQKVTEPAAPAPAKEAPAPVSKCRFCGAEMQTGAVFCPSCQRAQT